MLQEVIDSLGKKSSNSKPVTSGITVYKCSRPSCDGYAFAPLMQCTICHHTVHQSSNPATVPNSNGSPPCKQPRIGRHISAPILILSVGKAGIFDARHSPCVIASSGLTCHVKVEGCWCPVNLKSSEIKILIFCEELQVLLLKPGDTLKQSLVHSLKLHQSSTGDQTFLKWIILVLGDRMANSPEGNLSVQQMELLASAVRESNGICKMDCTLMEARKLLLDCGLRLPRAEARVQQTNSTSTSFAPTTAGAAHSALTNQPKSSQSLQSSSRPPQPSTGSEPQAPPEEGGLLTSVLNTLSSVGMHLFTQDRSNTRSVPPSTNLAANTSCQGKPESETSVTGPDDNDDIIILSEESTDADRSVATRSKSTAAMPFSSTSTEASPSAGDTFKLDYHPAGSADCVSLTQADLDCLEPGGLLNDAIINFYLKYLYFEQLTDVQRHATYLFNCFFYSRLASAPSATGGATGGSHPPVSANVSAPSLIRHANVAKWTRRVDLFSKDYIIIPINEASHWFLGLVCYPWMAGMVSYTALYRVAAFDLCQLTQEFSDVDQISFTETVDDWALNEEPIERRPDDLKGAAFDRWRRRRLAWLRRRGINAMPCILLFDSLPCQTRVNNLHVIRDYLQVEWDTRRSEQDGPLHFNKDTIRGFSPRVPSQSNLVDCGIYLLHYVEMFFKQPVQSYTKDYFQHEMASWFSEDTVSQKRMDIRTVLTRLHAQQTQ